VKTEEESEIPVERSTSDAVSPGRSGQFCSGCTPGSTDEAGDQMSGCAIRPGMGHKTEVHCIDIIRKRLKIAGHGGRKTMPGT